MRKKIEQPSSGESWKKRGSKEKSYRARKVSHEAETSIEYGEKTWTTAQTVRDLMQNHLDAETEMYYQQIAKTIFNKDILKQYFDSSNNEDERKRAEDLIYAAFTFANYVEDMTPEARLQSEEHLQKLAHGLSVNSALQQENTFSPSLFLEAVRPIEEKRPLVSYEVIDTESDTGTRWISYETLRDEELYKSINKGVFRYKITGMKIIDHGPGFDSQLSALYLSSKTGKKHLRGKFGEGIKMSELHLLRNGASMKMRSRYTIKSDDEAEKSRVWQTRPRVKDDRLVLRGVEVEQESEEKTGSTVFISLRGANEDFRKDFLSNVDPRLKGLERNIADFSSQKFSYPMPITEKHLSGVDISGDGNIQYVQGLRVNLAKESFGYGNPWFSYNFLDSSIISGRDRNEIKVEIRDRINSFWRHVDNPELLEKLVQTAVHDSSRNTTDSSYSPELSALGKILTAEGESKSFLKRIQKIVDNALLRELAIEKQVHTLIISSREKKDLNLTDVMSYALEQGYEIKTTAAEIGFSALKSFATRMANEYYIFTFTDIQYEMHSDEIREDEEEMVEGEREKAIRKVFLSAVASVNELVSADGREPQTFELKFDMPKKVNVGRRQDSYRDDDYEDDYYNSDFDLSPITLSGWLAGDVDYIVHINPNRISDPRYSDPRAVQKEIEIYLLSAFAYSESDEKETLKRSQRLLDTLIGRLIPENDPVLEAIPKQLEYEKDPNVLLRLIKFIHGEAESKHEKEKIIYKAYQKALDTRLTFDEAQEMHKRFQDNTSYYTARNVLESRVFLNDGTLTYYNSKTSLWEKQNLEKIDPITKWRGLPVYALNDGRYFIPSSMQKGAVLAKGEGKKREYTFSEGNNFLRIGQDSVEFGKYGYGFDEDVAAHPAGLTLTSQEFIQNRMDKYNYYPAGVTKLEGSIEKGVVPTAIPIEYGQDAWDNPIRIFQDVIQNHIDASKEGQRVQLTYEVDRNGNRELVSESDLLPSDKITGLTIQDKGSGYYPNDIATMGASSKKSPLFAGKYGEGQKMIAAAALRNNLDLTYKSTIQSSSGIQSWEARAVDEARLVVLDGKEVEKKLVAFDVVPTPSQAELGSATTLRLPLTALPEQKKQWAEWISIIDPRQKDANGNGGLARYVRQLRQPGSARVHTVGSISVLLDEPGAVYENGLRINPQAEKGRSLSFGYDIPEIVTTRERNSYNAGRLWQYIKHVISNIQDPSVIEEILHKVANSDVGTLDLDIGSIMGGSENAASIWAEIAQKVWPDYVVYSSELIHDEIHDYDLFSMGGSDEMRKERREKAKRIQANMRRLDKSRVLDVPEESYDGFSRLLPTAESVIEKMETEVLPAPPAIKKVLSKLVAESTKVFADMLQKARETLTDEQLKRLSLREDLLSEWNNAAAIEQRNAVAIAPIDSAYHGKADKGVVIFNEELLFLNILNNRRELATTSLHEVAHIVSGYHDYQENFVTLLYDLAQYLAKDRQIKKAL